MLVVVEIRDPTVSCDVVAISERPSADDVMIELGANDVVFVPPLDTGRVPVIVVSVVVATQLGTPLTRASVNPFVVAASLDRTFVFDAYSMSPVVYPVCPVPPYSAPIDVVAETTPLFACSGPLREGFRVRVEMFANVDELVTNDE